jgi:hypothetical protein
MTGVRAGPLPQRHQQACKTNWRSGRGLIDHPTTMSEHTSSTIQRNNQCSAMRISVLSVTHLVLGAAALKSADHPGRDEPSLGFWKYVDRLRNIGHR